jgi:hypothetical protein
MLPAMEKQDPGKALVTTLALEREINTFFRLTSPSVIRRLTPESPPTSFPVFLLCSQLWIGSRFGIVDSERGALR